MPWALASLGGVLGVAIQMAMQEPGIALENLKSARMAGSWPCRIHQIQAGQSRRLLLRALVSPVDVGRIRGLAEEIVLAA